MKKKRVSPVEKRRTWLQYLHEEPTFFVLCDTRDNKKIIVPVHLRHQPQVAFQLGSSVPTQDLRATYGGWSALLMFQGEPYWCHIPWDTVFGLCRADGSRCTLWNPPPEALAQPDDRRDLPLDTPETRRKTLPPYLRVIEGGRARQAS